MKTSDYLGHIKYYNNLKTEAIHKVMLCRMAADNIRDIVPDYLNIEPNKWVPAILIKPKDENATADIFENATKKISQKLHEKPDIEITKEKLKATWWFNFKEAMIKLELYFGNTEQCEIEYTEETIQVPKLTGYCAKLKEMQYDTN